MLVLHEVAVASGAAMGGDGAEAVEGGAGRILEAVARIALLVVDAGETVLLTIRWAHLELDIQVVAAHALHHTIPQAEGRVGVVDRALAGVAGLGVLEVIDGVALIAPATRAGVVNAERLVVILRLAEVLAAAAAALAVAHTRLLEAELRIVSLFLLVVRAVGVGEALRAAEVCLMRPRVGTDVALAGLRGARRPWPFVALAVRKARAPALAPAGARALDAAAIALV